MVASKKKTKEVSIFGKGGASNHQELINNFVHVFVDDQNLFWGAVQQKGRSFRIDFGHLLILVARKSPEEKARGVKTAYIAGVIPDDDSFWKVAETQGFKVLRGYLAKSGSGRRSKQDDSMLITEMMETIYEQEGPSTIVLVAGDADYVPPLEKAIKKGWRVEVVFHEEGFAKKLDRVAHVVRRINPAEYEKDDKEYRHYIGKD